LVRFRALEPNAFVVLLRDMNEEIWIGLLCGALLRSPFTSVIAPPTT